MCVCVFVCVCVCVCVYADTYLKNSYRGRKWKQRPVFKYKPKKMVLHIAFQI